VTTQHRAQLNRLRTPAFVSPALTVVIGSRPTPAYTTYCYTPGIKAIPPNDTQSSHWLHCHLLLDSIETATTNYAIVPLLRNMNIVIRTENAINTAGLHFHSVLSLNRHCIIIISSSIIIIIIILLCIKQQVYMIFKNYT